MENRDTSAAKAQTQGLIARLAGRFGVEPNRLLKCLTTQVFKQADGRQPSNEELMVLLLVCENFGLNPFNREIFAFRGKGGEIVPVVSLDGWAKIVRSQKDFNGVTFAFSNNTVKVPGCAQELPEFVECAMRLKGVDEPIVIQEFMVECFNDKSPVWRKWPRRMLRTRAFIQCARLAFSLTGLYDEGEDFAEDLSGMVATGSVPPQAQQPAIAQTSVPKLALEREKLDEMLGKLMVFAQNQPNGWERAAKWVEAKLTGDDRLYAEEKLRLQQMTAQAQEQLPEPADEDPNLIEEEDSRAFA
jgi:phage recombination protein Bet